MSSNKIRKRDLPEKLKAAQEMKRNETRAKVETAITELQEEGYIVTISNLVERTGLSRSTFSKSHIEEILKEKKVCKFAQRVKIVDRSKSEIDMNRTELLLLIEKLRLEIVSRDEKIEKEITKNCELNNKINSLKVENLEQKERIQKLLGELTMMSQKMSKHGFTYDVIKGKNK